MLLRVGPTGIDDNFVFIPMLTSAVLIWEDPADRSNLLSLGCHSPSTCCLAISTNYTWNQGDWDLYVPSSLTQHTLYPPRLTGPQLPCSWARATPFNDGLNCRPESLLLRVSVIPSWRRPSQLPVRKKPCKQLPDPLSGHKWDISGPQHMLFLLFTWICL